MTYQRLPQVPPMELPENLKETFALLVPYFDAAGIVLLLPI